MNYYDKYMKYKSKYIKYKRLHYGGANLYNFKDITYDKCNIDTDNNIICDEIEYTINNITNKTKNIKWYKMNNSISDKYNNNNGYYNNDYKHINWTYSRNNTGFLQDNKIKYSKINVFSMNLKYYDYNNCFLSSKLSFYDNKKVKNEQNFYYTIKNIILNSTDYTKNLEDIKKLLVVIIDNNNIEIKKNKLDLCIGLLKNFKENKENINKYKIENDYYDDKYETVYFIDGNFIFYCVFNKKQNKIEHVYTNLSYIFLIVLFTPTNFIISDYINSVYSLIIKYIIENFKLKEIILYNDINIEIDNDLKMIILDKKDKSIPNSYNILHNNNLLFLIKIYKDNIKKWENTIIHSDINIINIIKTFLNFNDSEINNTSIKYLKYHDGNKSIAIERINNRFYGPIYCRDIITNLNYYIFNFNNLKIFENNKWKKASDFQIWAYTDFILKKEKKINYRSKFIIDNTAIEIDVYGINEDIEFSIQYGEYNNIFYVNKLGNSFIICDNERVRNFNSSVYLFHKSNKKYKEIINIDNKSISIPWPELTWFNDFFKFIESKDYDKNKESMLIIFINNKIKDLNCGIFEVFSCEELHQLLDIPTNNKNKNNKVSIKNIFMKVEKIHDNHELANSTIQVASQLNCLEMTGPSIFPEYGITIYAKDKTQGPACAMCAPAGLAYRNYIYDGGQTHNKQIDMSSKLLDYLKTKDNKITWNVRNGYLLFDNEYKLKKINELLQDKEIFKEAKKLIQSGSHSQQGIRINNNNKNYTMNHVYCSGLPISYNNNINNDDLWDILSILFLEGLYENTLLIAVMNNLLSREIKPCFLTKVGGGVFRMKDILIVNAIKKACNTIYNLGFNLEIFLVNYNLESTNQIYIEAFNELTVCPIN